MLCSKLDCQKTFKLKVLSYKSLVVMHLGTDTLPQFANNLEKGGQTPMAQSRSTKIMSIIKWIRTSRLLIKKSLSANNLSQRVHVVATPYDG